MALLRRLRHLPTLFATSFTSFWSALAISVVRIRQPHDPAKLYFGAKVAFSLDVCESTHRGSGNA
jgi:hypothetical protein